MERKRFHWKAQLQRDDGRVEERDIRVFWDPAQEDAAELVANAAAAEAYWASGKKHQFAGVSAVLQG